MQSPNPTDSALLDIDQLDAGVIYQLLSATIVPRPIAWVSTIDSAGNANLAPFSFFNVASVDPPILAFSPLLNDRSEVKDTIRNLEQVKECVVHVGCEPLIEALNATSATLPPDADEFEYAGLGKASLGDLKVPRIAESPIAFGCHVRDILSFGDRPRSGRLVLAEIVVIHADPEVWDGRHVNLDELRPIGRLAGADYIRCSDTFSLVRPG